LDGKRSSAFPHKGSGCEQRSAECAALFRPTPLIRARTGEGRERAKARGVKMGRKPKLTPHQQAEAIKRREAGEPIREIARTYNVHNSTISRLTT